MPRSNEFPHRPIPAVGAIVFRGEAVLLVKRGEEPNKGRWSVPGGVVEVGETVEAAVVRETSEETQVDVRPNQLLEVREFIEFDKAAVRWHYVLIDVLCEYLRGEPVAGSDAGRARFIPLRELSEYDVTPTALDLLQEASTTRAPPSKAPRARSGREGTS